jgi:adenylate cyclase
MPTGIGGFGVNLRAVAEEQIDSYLEDEEAKAEELAALVRLGLIAGLLIMSGFLFIGSAISHELIVLILIVAAPLILYGFGLLRQVRRRYRPILSFVSIAVDVAAITAITLASGLFVGRVEEATKSPFSLLYFLVIATAGLRQDARLAVFASLASVIGYLTLFLGVWVVSPQSITGDLHLDFSDHFVSPIRIGTVTALILLGGAVTAMTARRARQLVRRAVDERTAAIREQERRQTLLSVMERYFPEREALQMIAQGQDLERGGERRRLTAMMTDIRGFTTFAEQLPPDRVVELLNRYFEEMVGILFAHQGTLITFLGDGILAVFGLPEERPDDADRALQTALAMRSRLQELNASAVFEQVGGLRIGMALHSGEALVGNVGSAQRQEYTVIGDTVNSVSRLEELNKTMGTDLLVSQATVDTLTRHEGLVDRGEMAVRGRESALRIYTVESEPAAAPA